MNKVETDKIIPITGAYGNASRMIFDSDALPAAGIAGVIYVLPIPRSSVVKDVIATVEAGFSDTSGTIDIGYIMGATTDDDYFTSAFDSVTGGQIKSASFPLTFTEDGYITVTANTAVTVVDKRLSVVVDYVYEGDV